jgi:CheY-like chemotaxis protein
MQSLKVLLVEDNPAEARLIRELLLDAPEPGVALEHVSRLEAGLERLEAGGVDVVLLDLSLPDSHGLETLQNVRAAASRVPVVVLTGSDEWDLALRAVEKGAQDYLIKGQVDGKAILRSVRYSIARARPLEALRESQRFMQQVAELLYVIDPATSEIDYLSPQMWRLIGAREDRARGSAGRRFGELVHPDDVEGFQERMKEISSLSNDQAIESEFRIRTGEQGWCWLHVRETLFTRGTGGSPDLLMGTAQVLENRPNGDDALSSEIRLLRSAFEALPQPVFVKHADGSFLLSNAAHRRSLGVPGSKGAATGGFRTTALRDPSGALLGLLGIGETESVGTEQEADEVNGC